MQSKFTTPPASCSDMMDNQMQTKEDKNSWRLRIKKKGKGGAEEILCKWDAWNRYCNNLLHSQIISILKLAHSYRKQFVCLYYISINIAC